MSSALLGGPAGRTTTTGERARFRARAIVAAVDPSVTEFLRSAFEAHGVRGELRDGWLDFGASRPAVRGSVHRVGERLWKLNVQVFLPDGSAISEAHAAPGSSLDDAFARLRVKFLSGSFHVLLAAFFDRVDEEQITVEQWEVHGVPWTVVLGPLTGEQSGERPMDVPPGLMPVIERAAVRTVPTLPTRWCRFFHARFDGQPGGGELLVNDINDAAAFEAITAQEWPRLDGYQSKRLFLVMRRGVPPEPIVGTLHWPTVCAAVRELTVLAERSLDNEQLVAHLEASGCDPLLASKVVAMGPEAFATVLFPDLPLSSTFELAQGDGAVVERSWATESVFLAAHDLAVELRSNREAFLAIAGRSSIVGAVNNALHGGMSMDAIAQARFSPPRITL